LKLVKQPADQQKTCDVIYSALLSYNNPQVKYVMDEELLQWVTEQRVLGVIVSEDLQWEKQCSIILATNTANVTRGMIISSDRSQEPLIP